MTEQPLDNKTRLQRFLRIARLVWLVTSILLFAFSLYGWANANVSYKYEVEAWGQQPMPKEVSVRARWIEEQITVSKFLAFFLGVNTLLIIGTMFIRREAATA